MSIAHLITHLSISQLNMWRATPKKYGKCYLKGERESVPQMWRGTAVDKGFEFFLRSNGNAGGALDEAHRIYEQEAQGEIHDEIEAQHELIEPMLKQAMLWNTPSRLNAAQVKIEFRFDSVPVPLVGYLDFAFNEIDVDLKSTAKMPSYPPSDHVRQVSLYRAVRHRRGGLLYVTAKRHEFFEIGDTEMEEAMLGVEADAISLFRLLDRARDPDDFIAMLPEFDRYEKRVPKNFLEAAQ